MTTEAPKKDEKALATKRKTLPELLNDEDHKTRLAGILGKDARSFAQNILTVYNGSKSLQECEPESIIAACEISASINLSILPSLGHSCVVPYQDGDRLVAQWQIMWKGLIQLAHRSGQYKKVHMAHVYEGELKAYDRFKNVIDLTGKKISGRVQGYYFYFELLTGGVFEFYWSALECIEHGLRYSKSFQKGKGKWTEDPAFAEAGSVKKWIAGKSHFLTEGSGADAMCAKTIVKNELQTWGPLETRIKELVANDQAVIGVDGAPKYIDTTAEPAGETQAPTPPPTGGKDQKPPAGDRIAWVRADVVKKGIEIGRFDAWLGAQEGDQEVVATAAEKEWQRLAKAIKAGEKYEAFLASNKVVTFKVASVAESEFENEENVVCIRDDQEPPTKRYTNVPEVIKAARAAQKISGPMAAHADERKSGKNTFDWLTKLA